MHRQILGSRRPADKGVVEFIDFFEHCGPNGTHVCMVFEVMGPNLLSLIKQFNFDGVSNYVVETVRGARYPMMLLMLLIVASLIPS